MFGPETTFHFRAVMAFAAGAACKCGLRYIRRTVGFFAEPARDVGCDWVPNIESSAERPQTVPDLGLLDLDKTWFVMTPSVSPS